MSLTERQRLVLNADGNLLVKGGPGSGKTTISILKAAKIIREQLSPGQKVLFLSFARATVSRVAEAISEQRQISAADRKRIEVETYHSFFWRVLKSHGYLVGLPRKLSILTPANEAIALSAIRSDYKSDSKLTDAERSEKAERENNERLRLACEEGSVCFDLFASNVGALLHGSKRLRSLVATMYPSIILDEFQDTNADQWYVVKALGQSCMLIALADPDQRIFGFIGADPARLDHFRAEFTPKEFDLSTENHRSKGTDIANFGDDILKGKFRAGSYQGIDLWSFGSNANQAFAALAARTLQARNRLVDSGKKNWSLAILVPTKRMTRQVSDSFRSPVGNFPVIPHAAAVDMEGAILAAEVVAFLMQPDRTGTHFGESIDLVCAYFQGKGGDTPSQTSIREAQNIRIAYEKDQARSRLAKPRQKNSLMVNLQDGYDRARSLPLSGNPDADWRAIREVLEACDCPRLQEIGSEVRNVRLLDRGTELRNALSQDWRDFGEYRNALMIVRESFVREHFSTASKPETGIIVMNMHKAKGKQFDEVIIFEGWPRRVKGKIVSNPDRIVRSNELQNDFNQYCQNFRVSITRAKARTTILTPQDDPCVLLKPRN